LHQHLLNLLEFLAVATVVAVFARRFRVPYSAALVAMGLVLSYFKLLPSLALNPDVVINLFLPVLLFEAAINTDASQLGENFRPVALLSTLGMLVMTLITGGLLHMMLGLPLPVALLLGSMLSITDTVSVLAIFKELKVPPRLATIVEGESLFNDGTALVLFRMLLAVVATGTFDPLRSVTDVILVSLGGLLVGGVLGLACSWVLQQTRDHLTEIMLTTLLALGAFFVSEQLHVSGVIAVVVAGLVVGNYGWRRSLAPSSQIALGSFWEYAGFGVNSVVFLLVGINIHFVDVVGYIPAILVAYAAIHVGRLFAVYPAFWLLKRSEPEPVPLPWQHAMLWGNIKGSLTMALAISLPLALPYRNELITISFGVVLLSLLVQALSLGRVVHWLGIGRVSTLRERFEREQLKVMASRAAQNEVKTLHEAGILSKTNYERLRARYQVSVAQAERELRRLSTDYQAYMDEALADIMQRLVLVEKSAVLNALRERLVSEDVAREFLLELDQRLVEGPGHGGLAGGAGTSMAGDEERLAE
jgi:CPA1 family monovalent cation:H+ antiporter